MTLAELDNAIRLADGCTDTHEMWVCGCEDSRHGMWARPPQYSSDLNASMAVIRRRWPELLAAGASSA